MLTFLAAYLAHTLHRSFKQSRQLQPQPLPVRVTRQR